MDPVVRAQIKPCWPGVSTAGALGSTVKHLQVWDLQPLAPSQPANLSQKMMCHPQVSTCPFLLPADTDFWQCFPRSQTLCFSVSLPSPQVLVSHLSHKTPSVCRKRQIEVCNREIFFLFYYFFFSRDRVFPPVLPGICRPESQAFSLSLGLLTPHFAQKTAAEIHLRFTCKLGQAPRGSEGQSSVQEISAFSHAEQP